MLNKTQSISVRLSPDDYAYLMSIDRNGAFTQSEKVRELIAMARESVGVGCYARSYLAAGESMLPIKSRYLEESHRSLLVESLLELVSESAAAIHACAQDEKLAPVLEQRALPAVESFLEKILLLSVQDEPRLVDQAIAETIKQRVKNLVQY